MRTTIDLPEDLHQRVSEIARETSRSLSETVVELMRRGLEKRTSPAGITIDEVTGLPVVHLGTVVTPEDVRHVLEDDE